MEYFTSVVGKVVKIHSTAQFQPFCSVIRDCTNNNPKHKRGSFSSKSIHASRKVTLKKVTLTRVLTSPVFTKTS